MEINHRCNKTGGKKMDEFKEKIVNGIMIFTDRAIKALHKEYKINLDKLTEEQLRILLNKSEYDKQIIIDDSRNTIWTEDDMKALCYTDDMGDFYKIEELKLYTAQYPPNEGRYKIFGEFGDVSKFLKDYLMVRDYDDEESCDKIFEDNLKNIHWYNKTNEIKQAVDEQLEKMKSDILKDKLLIFVGKDIDSLVEQIEAFAGSEKECDFKGLYYGKRVYRIANKLYYFSSNSFKYNGKYYWVLQELGKKGYQYYSK